MSTYFACFRLKDLLFAFKMQVLWITLLATTLFAFKMQSLWSYLTCYQLGCQATVSQALGVMTKKMEREASKLLSL